MRLTGIQTALVPISGMSAPKKRPQAPKRARLARAEDFETLLEGRSDFIEADFEEVDSTGQGSGGGHYTKTLFPEFLWKCLYVNYYV